MDCFNYLNGCTVNLIDVNGLLTLQGCTPLKKCKDYQKDQCYKSIDKNQNNEYIDCGWNGQVCDDKSCLTADNSYNTHILCSQYFQGCTVNNTNDGCITIPETCEIMTEQQCYINSTDKNNNQCIWIAETNKCETKTCENSPNYANEAECNAHLKDCSLDSIKCKTKVCEDFNFTTDDECKNALSQNQCSSNGITCVSRGFCEQAQAEIGCTFDSQGKLCQWMPAGYCTLRNCSTAPNTLITEEQCQQYYKPTNQSSCTTKKNGGCTIKSQCNIANVQAACTTDNTGAKCQWDTDKCRLQECIDFKGSTHYECNKIRSNCTVGLNGKCAQMQNCENTTIQQACIIGNNGTCLWISKYINNDGTLGACFQYDSCQSMKWKTHEQCQIISPNCTTNGESCIGITNCNETNINGGCHIGTDGQCIQTVLAKQSKDVICKKYQNCESAYYLTHQECNMSNPNCTSDYKIGCISLDSCSSFSLQEQCHINKDGTIKDKEGAIISTGNCVWDSASGKGCRDEQCMDIVLTTEKECSQKLKYCSTNGTTCITKQKCDQYIDENACKNAGGIDGSVCIWSAGTGTIAASCRIKLCTDIQNGSTNQACSIVPNCVTDGVNCVKMTVCSEYTTKVACMQKGTSGFCFWTEPLPSEKQGKCELMTSCKYGNDEFTCNQVNDRCEWNSNTLQCSSYTCQSYQKKTNKCQYYPSWNLSTYTICSINNGNCIETDPQKLSENDCYVQSTYRYYWDTAKSKCSVCQNSNQVNSTNNTANNSNNVDASSILMKIVVYSILISV